MVGFIDGRACIGKATSCKGIDRVLGMWLGLQGMWLELNGASKVHHLSLVIISMFQYNSTIDVY